MRVPRVRFTVRRIMVAMAIVAIGLGGWARYRLGEVTRSNYGRGGKTAGPQLAAGTARTLRYHGPHEPGAA